MSSEYHAVKQIGGDIYGVGWSYDSAVEYAKIILGQPTIDIIDLDQAQELDLVCIPCERIIYNMFEATEVTPKHVISDGVIVFNGPERWKKKFDEKFTIERTEK